MELVWASPKFHDQLDGNPVAGIDRKVARAYRSRVKAIVPFIL
jgi:hypothetical protein